jgi:hypothetical protein
MSRRRLGRVNNGNHARCMHESAWKSNIAIKKEVVVIVYRKKELNVIFH